MKSTERFVGAWVAAALCALILAAAPVGTARADYDDEDTSEDIWDSCKDFSLTTTRTVLQATCNYENPTGAKKAATRSTNIDTHSYVGNSSGNLVWGNSYGSSCLNVRVEAGTDSVVLKAFCRYNDNPSDYNESSITISDKIENDNGYLKYNANR